MKTKKDLEKEIEQLKKRIEILEEKPSVKQFPVVQIQVPEFLTPPWHPMSSCEGLSY